MPFGHMLIEFRYLGIARTYEVAGLGGVLIDMELGPFDVSKVAQLIACFKAINISPVVRIQDTAYHSVSRVMDARAHGIMAQCAICRTHTNSTMQYVTASSGNHGPGLRTSYNEFILPNPEP